MIHSFSTPGQFFVGFCFLLKLLFTQQKNQQRTHYSLLQYLNTPPPQVRHKLTCFHNYRGYEGEEAGQVEDWGGVSCKGKGQKDEG